jgi:putative membrane protein
MRFIHVTCFAAFLLAGPAFADTKSAVDKDKAKLTDDEKAMIDHEHAVNQVEIQMGKMAQTKSTTAAVKDFGKQLVKDHLKADDDLTSFAKKRSYTIGKDKPKTDADKAAMKDDENEMAKIATLKGADFDREFTSMMVVAHERELAKLDTFLAIVNDADLKGDLESVKPVMQQHADKAKELQKNAPSAMK